MAMTFTMRKRCVIPPGTGQTRVNKLPYKERRAPEGLTVSKLVEVQELIAPLSHYSEGVFEERNHNKESSDGR
jgi:hypothetical protein